MFKYTFNVVLNELSEVDASLRRVVNPDALIAVTCIVLLGTTFFI